MTKDTSTEKHPMIPFCPITLQDMGFDASAVLSGDNPTYRSFIYKLGLFGNHFRLSAEYDSGKQKRPGNPGPFTDQKERGNINYQLHRS